VAFLTEISGPDIQDAAAPRWVFDQIERWAEQSPDRVAFVIDHQDRLSEYRYADVLRHANLLAAKLQANGVRFGDHVGILMENVPQWVFALLAAMRLGAVTVPLATTLPESSIQRIAEHAGCGAIFADDANWEKAGRVSAALGSVVLSTQETDHDVGATAESPAQEKMRGTDTALLIYTSGTTGNPKGVELTVDNLNYEISGAAEALHLHPDHRILSVLPFSHVLPLIGNGLGPLCIGATVVFLSSISPQRIIEAFQRHRITLFICVPQFFYVLHRRIFAEAAAQPFSGAHFVSRNESPCAPASTARPSTAAFCQGT
jgi:long-subunit acyl-CoA synthetase (AMP-forming)